MNGIRAGLVAVALGGTALVGVAPAQAAVSFGLNFNIPGPGPGVILRFGTPNYYKYCWDNSKIRRELRQAGYRDVQIVREQNNINKVWAVGRKGGEWFQMRVDRCNGRVDRIREIDGPNRNGRFSLTFTF
jgi:hypothetical protein